MIPHLIQMKTVVRLKLRLWGRLEKLCWQSDLMLCDFMQQPIQSAAYLVWQNLWNFSVLCSGIN